MSKKYVDVKVSVWQRWYLTDDANISEIIEDLKKGVDLETATADFFDEAEYLYDTTEEMMPIENDGNATIEVYDESVNAAPLYTNEMHHLA